MTAFMSLREGIAKLDVFVSMSLANKANGHGVPGVATSPSFNAGTFRVADSGVKWMSVGPLDL